MKSIQSGLKSNKQKNHKELVLGDFRLWVDDSVLVSKRQLIEKFLTNTSLFYSCKIFVIIRKKERFPVTSLVLLQLKY